MVKRFAEKTRSFAPVSKEQRSGHANKTVQELKRDYGAMVPKEGMEMYFCV